MVVVVRVVRSAQQRQRPCWQKETRRGRGRGQPEKKRMKTRKQNRKRNRKRERRESWNKEGAAGCLVAADSSSLPALSLCSLSSTTSDSLSLSRPLSISSASAPTPSACSVSASTPPSHSRRAGIFRGVSARCGRHIKALQGAETSRKHGGNPLQEGLLEHRRSVRLLSLFLFFCCVRSLWIPLTASAPARERARVAASGHMGRSTR